MAKRVLYYTAVTGGRCYIFYLPDGSTKGIQYERGVTVHLPADYAEREQYNRYPVTYPMEGWLHKGYCTNITEVTEDVEESCTPPSSVLLNPETLTLTVSGGGDATDYPMTGYQVQYRERSTENRAYTDWTDVATVYTKGAATVEVSVSAGKARQFRARTICDGAVSTYSIWVVCPTELISGAETTPKTGLITLHVYDRNLNYKGRVENWTSFSWNEEYQGTGSFMLTVPDTEKHAAILSRGCFLYRNDRTTPMMAVSVERNSKNRNIIVGGYSAVYMLNQRVALGMYDIDNLEAGVYGMIEENLRGLPITCAPAQGFEDTVDHETLDHPVLLEGMMTLLREGDMGVRTVFDPTTAGITLELYKGTDRSYKDGHGEVFSTEFGNLYGIVVTEDDGQLKNVACVVCDNGDGTKRIFTYDPTEAEGIDRFELYIYGESRGVKQDEKGNAVAQTDEEWEKAMLDMAKRELTAYNLVQTFEVTPNTDNYGRYYFLGDKVTCKSSRYGLRFDARITQAKETYDRNGGSLTLTLGEPTINYFRR